MDGQRLQDKISRGMGAAARKLGMPFTVFRPNGAADPLDSRNRLIRLFASFNAEDPHYRSAAGFGHPLRYGVFDASYTRPGDYLCGEPGIYFVCAQEPLLPVQCVLTNRCVTIARATAATPGEYSGFLADTAQHILTRFPASLLDMGARTGGEKAGRFGTWSLLLPPVSAQPQVGDVVTDEMLTTYVVGAAEASALGWRLIVRQIAA